MAELEPNVSDSPFSDHLIWELIIEPKLTVRNYAPNVLLNDNLKLPHIAKGVTNTCISVHGVGCPKGHLDVMTVATHKPVLVEKTDSAVLENSGSSIG